MGIFDFLKRKQQIEAVESEENLTFHCNASKMLTTQQNIQPKKTKKQSGFCARCKKEIFEDEAKWIGNHRFCPKCAHTTISRPTKQTVEMEKLLIQKCCQPSHVGEQEFGFSLVQNDVGWHLLVEWAYAKPGSTTQYKKDLFPLPADFFKKYNTMESVSSYLASISPPSSYFPKGHGKWEDKEKIQQLLFSNTKAEKQDVLSEKIESTKMKLASYFSQDIVDNVFREFNMYCRIEGLSITAETDFGRRTTIAQAKDENELFFKVIKEITKTCAQKYEQIHREGNSKAWRYLRSKVVDGHWMYTENVNYIYNAIEDTRKVWFEKHISAMAFVFSIESVSSLISEYTALMNGWFDDSHWAFNSDLMEFVEISSSKERDTDGKEHPMQNEILR